MLLRVHHRTTYRFDQPQARLVQLLRVLPDNDAGQSVIRWDVEVDRDARLRRGRDGYGNHITMLYVDGPLDAITVAVRGEVLTEDRGGLLAGTAEPLPPMAFLQPTAVTAADRTVRAFVDDLSLPTDPLDRAHALSGAVGAALERQSPAPGTDPRAASRLSEGRADARGMAHVLIAAARALGVPARYVAGHLYRAATRSEQAAHGWAELHVDGVGWVGFDPFEGRCPSDAYIRVAIGLDHSQAAPIAGARIGPGAETLSVDVRVGGQN